MKSGEKDLREEDKKINKNLKRDGRRIRKKIDHLAHFWRTSFYILTRWFENVFIAQR